MAPREPTVSIVVPCYNQARYLDECLKSALAGADPASEILVVDDGSTEPIQPVVERYSPRVRYLRQANQGAATARNTGLRAASGRYVRFLDSDDYLLPNDALRRQVALLEAGPEVGLVFGQALKVDELGRPFGTRRPRFATGDYARTGERELTELLFTNYITTSTALVRRSAIEAVGGFDPSYGTMTEDWECWLRLARRWSFAYLDDLCVAYRVHSASASSRQRVSELLDRRASTLQRFLLDEWYRDHYAKLRPAIETYQLILAAWLCYAGRDLAEARRYARQALPRAVDSRRGGYVRDALWILARSSLPGGLQLRFERVVRLTRRTLTAARLARQSTAPGPTVLPLSRDRST